MRLKARMIRPEFWTDGDVLRWPRDKRLFYVSLWAVADDAGCFRWDAYELKAAAWPLDADITPERIEAWLAEMEEQGKVVSYMSNGRRYGYVCNFGAHQAITHPRVHCPLPPWVQVEGRRVVHGAPAVSEEAERTMGQVIGSHAVDAPRGVKSLPPCFDAEAVIDGRRAPLATHLHDAVVAAFGFTSEADRAKFAQAVTDGCVAGCTGELQPFCTTHLIGKVVTAKKRGATLRLVCKMAREDREEAKADHDRFTAAPEVR